MEVLWKTIDLYRIEHMIESFDPIILHTGHVYWSIDTGLYEYCPINSYQHSWLFCVFIFTVINITYLLKLWQHITMYISCGDVVLLYSIYFSEHSLMKSHFVRASRMPCSTYLHLATPALMLTEWFSSLLHSAQYWMMKRSSCSLYLILYLMWVWIIFSVLCAQYEAYTLTTDSIVTF